MCLAANRLVHDVGALAVFIILGGGRLDMAGDSEMHGMGREQIPAIP